MKTLNSDSVQCYDMILVCQALLITTAEHGLFCGSLKLLCFLLDGGSFYKYPKYVKRRSTVGSLSNDVFERSMHVNRKWNFCNKFLQTSSL